jgi:small conductance mechanosensitive channel
MFCLKSVSHARSAVILFIVLDMSRIFIILFVTLFLGSADRAGAQSATVAASVAADQKAPDPAANDPAKIRALVETLQDPQARERLTQQLELLAGAQEKANASKPEAEAVGSRMLTFLLGKIDEARGEFGALDNAFAGLPAAGRWIERQMNNPQTRARWAMLAELLAEVLTAGTAIFWLGVFVLRRPRHALDQRKPSKLRGRIMFGFARLLLGLVPVVLFSLIGYLALPLFSPPKIVSVATITIVNATMLVLVVIGLSRFFFAPRAGSLRLVRMSGDNARFVHRWLSIVAAILAFGWFGISAARVLGLPNVASLAAFKVVALIAVVISIGLVIRKRRDVADWIRDGNDRASEASQDLLGSIRRNLADVWHVLAIAYLAGIFVIWALDLDGGFAFVLRGTVASVLVVGLGRLAVVALRRAAARGIALSNETRGRFPHLQTRANHYIPLLHGAGALLIWGVALLALADVWGLDISGWFDSPGGKALLARIVSIGFVIVSATVAWEFVSAVIERYLVGAVRDGTAVERSQRVRTLLPLIRNAFLIFLIVVVVLIVLSEIGLNIAPLLAGAGVFGLAIGFGAQTLVKDVITGIFILFENTLAVGDVADIGNGHSGVVEGISIRAIRLRDASGGMHTVPFSNVTSVINMTRDFANYIFNIKVDYGQDTDRVSGVLRDLGIQMETDPEYCGLILAPLEIVGVDSFGSDALILQAKFKTRPGKQWSVGREFNRRLKKRFDELKIPMSFPSNMVLSADGLAVQVKSDKAAAAT